ncbi:MAG: hypothetical protein GY855_12860 [candidate division Zixibacteria bacterium]|nr:hypothetical protein [candidate division Zixibacteria bacterium]
MIVNTQICRAAFFTTLVLFLLSLAACDFRSASETQSCSLTNKPQPPSPVYFKNGKNPSDIPFRLVDNGMLITIVVNGLVQLEVIFDSGFPMNGVLVTNPETVKKLNLQYVGKTPLGGAGDNLRTAKIAMDGVIGLTGVKFTNQYLLVTLQPEAFSDWPLDGVIGGTILNSCVVVINHDEHIINLYNSTYFDDTNSGEEIELLFSQGIPVVDATAYSCNQSGVDVKLLFDTGADVPLSFHNDVGSGFNIPDDIQECYISYGIGGAVYGKWGRTDSLYIGDFKIRDILTVFPTRGFDDVVTLLGQDGFFGILLQNRFNITFNYIEQKMYLNPNNKYAQLFEYNMAGLVLMSDKNGFRRVKDVVEESSGDIAGIKYGDLLIAVNNIEMHNLSGPELEELFRQEGRELILTLVRDSKQFQLSLVLERLF